MDFCDKKKQDKKNGNKKILYFSNKHQRSRKFSRFFFIKNSSFKNFKENNPVINFSYIDLKKKKMQRNFNNNNRNFNNSGGSGENQQPERTRVDRLFHSARTEHFSKNTRQKKLEENRKMRDQERARMEAYRKLCEKEGIKSRRLEEYDQHREENAAKIDEAIKSIDEDTKMSHKQRKEAKFKLKQKASSRVSELQPVRSVGAVLAQKAQKVAASREELAARREEEIKQRIVDKETKMMLRKKKAKAYALRTGTGQPVMAGRVRNLLDKVMKHAQK